jgi:hypothetical protein
LEAKPRGSKGVDALHLKLRSAANAGISAQEVAPLLFKSYYCQRVGEGEFGGISMILMFIRHIIDRRSKKSFPTVIIWA